MSSMIEGLSPAEFAEFVAAFLPEARERLAHLEQLLLACGDADAAARAELLVSARRELHTIKGSAGMMGFDDIRTLAHELEDAVQDRTDDAPGAMDMSPLLEGVDALRALLQDVERSRAADAGAGAAETVRVEPSGAGATAPAPAPSPARHDGGADLDGVRIPFAVLDALVDRVSDLVIGRNRLAEAVTAATAPDHGASVDAAGRAIGGDTLRHTFEEFAKGFDALQDEVLRLRMVPLRTLFGQLRRIVYDECARAAKRATLDTTGGDTPLDKALLDCASDALGHLVRNALVHGLESPDVRVAAGKPASGTVRLAAGVQGSEVHIDVIDDGAGIDTGVLARKARERGLDPAAFSDPYAVLFLPGFTTKDGTDISAGRGIGLSAVLESVRRSGGRVEVTSVPALGTRFRLRLPLSVSIMRALILRADGEEYALPLTAVIESMRLRHGELHEMNHAGIVRWRAETLPVMDLGHALGTSGALRQTGCLVVAEANGRRRGLVADAALGIRSIVVKALDPVVGTPTGIAGTTVLGDGRVIMILDPGALTAMPPFVPAVS